MARFRCRACAEDGTFAYLGRPECPFCGSIDVQFALGIEELADDDPLIEAMTRLAECHSEFGQGTLKSGFRCAACGQNGEHPWDPDPEAHRCPLCGSLDVVFARPTLALPDEFVDALSDAEPPDADENEK